MHDLKEKIRTLAAEYKHEVIAIRRHLHQHPELSMQEEQTAAFIRTQLEAMGIDYRHGIAGHGIVAFIRGKGTGDKVIALRADMDALPIEETSDTIYKSMQQGVMHACGHDVHMACMLGAAKILNELKDFFGGEIKLLFQPSEEALPGGAKMMIDEGILQNPTVQSIIGQHVAPQVDAGKVGIRSGMYMASADEIYLTVKGIGGHAGMPHLLVDPIVIASHIIIALQQIVSRNNTPWIPSVLSFGRVIAEGRTNIIPPEVKIDGTFRTFNEQWREQAHEKITSIAQGIAQGMGGACEVDIVKGFPFLENDVTLADNFRRYATEYLGSENIVELDISMTAEDFSWFSQQLPALFYRLGTRNESKGIVSGIHTSTFDIDENALETGMGLMAWAAVNELGVRSYEL
jgi:amidohydrolase